MVLPGYIEQAAMRGDLETLNDWHESGGDINDVDSDGFTILKLSLLFTNLEILKWAISHGAGVNRPGGRPKPTSRRPLHENNSR